MQTTKFNLKFAYLSFFLNTLDKTLKLIIADRVSCYKGHILDTNNFIHTRGTYR